MFVSLQKLYQMNTIKKRAVQLVSISDVHLGTYGSKAHALLKYLRSIKPEILVLNGDLFDIWQFKKRYFPSSHMKVIKQLTNMMAKGTTIYYITGNHDEMLRKFNGFRLGNLQILNHLTLDLDGKRAWFFHGDIFDVVIQNSKWLARIGAFGYDSLILLNSAVNNIYRFFGKGPIRLSKTIKDNVKKSKKYIGDFENSAARQGLKQGADYIICGHIHKPEMREIEVETGNIKYLNSGDWIENLTALEYNNKEWSIYHHDFNDFFPEKKKEEEKEEELGIVDMDNKKLFNLLIDELHGPGKN